LRHFDGVRYIQMPSGWSEIVRYVWRTSELTTYYDLGNGEREDLGEVIDINGTSGTFKWAVRHDYPELT